MLGTMAAAAPRYTAKELSPETWPDFEKLFAKHGGVQGGCWCTFYHRSHPIPSQGLTKEERTAKNRRNKKTLVDRGHSHGILIYDGNRPVGWCQYGLKEELPRIDAGRNYRKLALRDDGGRLWRITCFFVDTEYRRKGVARVALRAALSSIRKKGGGIVEAYPATSRRAVGIWFGTVGMFEREQFKMVSALGRNSVVMRRSIRESGQ